MLELTRPMLAGLPKNGPTDPIEYYRKPLVGWLFRERINRGLRLLPERRFSRALEVGYGAGAVQLALAPGVEHLQGIDLDADPELVSSLLEARGIRAKLEKGNVYELAFEDGSFDLVVSFSVFEHLENYRRALAEVSRVLRPGGLFLLGMPSVNRLMEAGFLAIGFKNIGDHHVTPPRLVEEAFGQAGLRLIAKDGLDLPARGLGLRLYHDFLLEKRGG